MSYRLTTRGKREDLPWAWWRPRSGTTLTRAKIGKPAAGSCWKNSAEGRVGSQGRCGVSPQNGGGDSSDEPQGKDLSPRGIEMTLAPAIPVEAESCQGISKRINSTQNGRQFAARIELTKANKS